VSEHKAGDKVWVLCRVIEPCENLMKVTGSGDDNWFWAGKGQCLPVEPANSPKILDSSSEALSPSPCMDGVDADQFIEGIMEARGRTSDPLQVGDAVRFVSPGHKRHGTEGAVYSKVDLVSSGCNYWFDSNCGQFSCYCTASQLERIDQADPVNPSHYKQGGIECIEAIKAATGDGFIGYVWGNVLKYLWRWPKKGVVEDLKKARWYLDRLIKEVGE
jgi:hypothetical protein